jgi:hypothetical protein
VRRARRLVSPPTCSAKVTFAQPGTGQKNRRTVRQIITSRPPAAVSSSRRSYRLCTRRDTAPHQGHAADEPQALAWTTHRTGRRENPLYQHIRQMRQQNISNIKIARPA